MRSVSLIIILFFFVFPSRSQDGSGHRISFHTAMNRLDFYSGFQYGKTFGHLETTTSLELGINRTFFQSRIFPRVTVGGAYYLIDREKLHVGPAVTYSYSFLEVNKSVGSIHSWNEIYGGYSLSVGKTWRFCHSILTGWMNERYRSQLTNKKVGVNTLGFYCNIGISYAW